MGFVGHQRRSSIPDLTPCDLSLEMVVSEYGAYEDDSQSQDLY